MSSSVQFDSGNTRMCSPLRWRPLYRLHSSGRCARGSQAPNSSRKLNTRSFARAFSSSRRAPPKTASKPLSLIPRSNAVVCKRFRLARAPDSSVTRPASMSSCTLETTKRRPRCATTRSRNSSTSSKLCPVSICITANGIAAGQNAFAARCSMTTESLPPEKSNTGCSNWAATSRKMWTDSASSARRSDSS